MRKNITILMIVISTMFMLTGCYMAFKDYYYKEDYKEIWELSGFRHGYDGVSPFFPESIDDLKVNKFLCRYDQQIPLGEGVQLFMEIQYTDKMVFDKEYEKIKSMANECDDFSKEIDLSAYVVRLVEEYCTEYALIDEEQQVINYIFIYGIDKDQIMFDHRFVPIRYDEYVNKYINSLEEKIREDISLE